MPRAQKGQRFGGRKKGTPNKLPRNLIERLQDIDGILESEGKGLLDCARQNPQWYHEHFVKPRIPKNMEITGADGGPIQTSMKVEFIGTNPQHKG